MNPWMIVGYGAVAAVAELMGGGLVLLRKQWPRRVQEYLLALGAGFILALVFVELIPAGLQAVGPEAALAMLTGYAVLHFFEHTIVGHLHFGEETHREVMLSRVASFATFAGLFIHAFFDGFSIAVGMSFSPYLGLLIFLAVLLHKVPEGLTIASVMIAADRPRKTAFLASAAIGAATMLGVLGALAISGISRALVGLSFAFSAGIATYVGASDLIPEINHSRNRVIPLLVFAGMLLFYGGRLVIEAALGAHAH